MVVISQTIKNSREAKWFNHLVSRRFSVNCLSQTKSTQVQAVHIR